MQTQGSILQLDLHGTVPQPQHKLGPLESAYVTIQRDGVRLALDIVRPMGDHANTKRDTILVMTRYWRSQKADLPPGDVDELVLHKNFSSLFVPHGYAVVVGDVRGTGASFGVSLYSRSRDETLDFSDVLDWIVAQPWSTGRVVGYGLSYTANTAEWMAERNHPALKGIIPMAASYDPYEEVYFPGGVCTAYGKAWADMVRNLDLNVPSPGVRPVGPDGEADLAAALRDHEPGRSLSEGLRQVTFKDDRIAIWGGASILDWSNREAADRVSRSGTPYQNWASWFDLGMAQGAVYRFLLQSNPMNVIIGPWNHSGSSTYDPLRADAEPIPPTLLMQHANNLRFADLCFNGQAGHEQGKIFHYYTLGEGWKSTRVWPLPATRQRWYMATGSRLTASPDNGAGFDSLEVDAAAQEDDTSMRWDTDRLGFGDRRKFLSGRLAYTSEPLTHDLEITGHPVVYLNITSTHEDGAFFVYLEAVKPDGESCYLTEGQLRALHRKVWTDSPLSALGPQHSYLKRDAEPLIPGEPAILTFTLHPISARLPAGYRLRVCLAGGDKPNFANLPADGAPPLLKFHHGAAGCYIDLPIIES
ncbi:CocE/NonD family hydrolase [Mesorhizobium sp.]|uniref:CocE/NonD family hydrolase n=1 Tax=Mesorhizobium sp. TaxID=1871066 RepID=UPI0011FE8D13|nr:CocE/NonD family hydrolase [Mesorhizobium sp.]TIO26761.1 MAG: CocE/NonD family hydrolase [Mesorhizobium sp.]